MENDKDRLASSIESLAKSEAKSASALWSFLRGMFYGVGFFVGSALLAAAIIYILSKFEGSSFIGGFIHDVVNNASKSKS
jgi:hypothetical protein